MNAIAVASPAPVELLPGERASASPEQGIAICLSGGGYRAMLFHTGAIWRLAELGLLGPATHNIRKADGSLQLAGTLQRISSVSGGSLLAGILGLKWKDLAVAQPGLVDRYVKRVVAPIGNCPSRWMGSEKGDVYFLWVYDCGTTSAQALLKNALDRFTGEYVAKKQILDLAVLSHFDKDHISGVVDLLERFEVDVLLLPFVPLAQRIILAFDEGIAVGDALFSFFINPVGYLNEAGIQRVRRVVFVPPSDGEGPGPAEALNDNPDRPAPERWPENEDAYRLDFDSHPLPDDVFDAAGDEAKGRIGSVSMLKPGSALRAASVFPACG